MADPNASPVGSNAGTLSAPDEGQLSSDISQIESQYEPRVEASEQRAEQFENQSVASEEEFSKYAEESAQSMSAQDQEMQQWVDATPTRQASYSTSMHAAPVLSVLMALGGKLTRLNGQQMLGAMTGMVQGLNESSEQKYNAAMDAWRAAFEKMRLQQQRLMDTHRMMLAAYKGRADAYYKASEAARRMTGDILDDKQRQIAQKVDVYKARSAAWDKLQRINYSYAALHERAKKDIAQESHWKKIETDAGKMPPEVKAQLAAAHSRFQSAKLQADENLKVRSQVSNSLTMPEDVKNKKLQDLDNEDEALKMEMQRATSDGDAITAGFVASRGGGQAPGAAPGAAPETNRSGTINRSGAPQQKTDEKIQLSPKRMQLLQQHKGQPVKWADGEYIMDADGSVHRVS
jgi:hypothetical protein